MTIGMLLLSILLIVAGLMMLMSFSIPAANIVLGVFAIVTGLLLLTGR
jgi:hypothetical protein